MLKALAPYSHSHQEIMRNLIIRRACCCLRQASLRKLCFSSTIFSSYSHNVSPPKTQKSYFPSILSGFKMSCFPLKLSLYLVNPSTLRYLHVASINEEERQDSVDASNSSDGELEPIDLCEEEDEAEPEVGDGGDGGGVVLQNCPWGERALSIARELIQEFDKDMQLYAFKTSPRGYIYVRLDKLPNPHGCPSMEEIESFSRQYKIKLDEMGSRGELPDDLALEVSSPGADRLLRVPDDLLRFKDMPMVVIYLDDSNTKHPEKKAVYHLDSIETESRNCVWKLADVRENRDPSTKGRPLSRKQRDSQIRTPFDVIKRVTLYLSY